MNAVSRRSPVDRYLPIAYLGMAFLLVIVVLPTSLRPPVQQPNQSAQLSPDSPPDDQSPILSNLNLAASGVDSGLALGVPSGGMVGGGLPAQASPAPRFCPRGFGNPPRQAESVYAPPCAGAWIGRNGGSTYKGVSATEIRIGVSGPLFQGASGNCERNGRVSDLYQANPRDNAVRTWYMLQSYFNTTFQLYGRSISFYCTEPRTTSVPHINAAAVQADEEFHIFGSAWLASPGCLELARRKIVSFCEEVSQHDKYAPYLWGAWMSSTEINKFAAEFFCKKLIGKHAIFAGDGSYQQTPRKFGLVTYSGGRYETEGDEFKAHLKRQCGADSDVILVPKEGDDAQGGGGLASAVIRMKGSGITTVMPHLDFSSTAALTNAATAAAYFPEWYVCDCFSLSQNTVGGLQDQTQWAHAFGLAGFEAQRPSELTDCYRAYKEVDPDNSPVGGICQYMWQGALLLVTGVQLAGPDLTPASFQRGWYRLGMRYHENPSWVQGGGFAPTGGGYDGLSALWTYPHNTAAVWWDPSADKYRYLYGGQRFCLGQLSANLDGFFKDGVTTPTDVAAVPQAAPLDRCPDVKEPDHGS